MMDDVPDKLCACARTLSTFSKLNHAGDWRPLSMNDLEGGSEGR